jgi:hypothetical protein
MGMLHGVTRVLRREFGTGKWRFGGARFEVSRIEKVSSTARLLLGIRASLVSAMADGDGIG